MAVKTDKLVPKRDTVKLTKSSAKRTPPTKRTLNLMIREKPSVDPAKWIPGAVVILIIAALIGKFAVADRYAALGRAESELEDRKRQLQETREAYADYDQVKDQYNRFTYTGFDRTIADRLDVLDILEREVFPVCEVQSIAISGRAVNLSVTDLSLSEASALKDSIETDPLVESFFVSTANHEFEDLNGSATITIQLVDASTVEGGAQS